MQSFCGESSCSKFKLDGYLRDAVYSHTTYYTVFHYIIQTVYKTIVGKWWQLRLY